MLRLLHAMWIPISMILASIVAMFTIFNKREKKSKRVCYAIMTIIMLLFVPWYYLNEIKDLFVQDTIQQDLEYVRFQSKGEPDYPEYYLVFKDVNGNEYVLRFLHIWGFRDDVEIGKTYRVTYYKYSKLLCERPVLIEDVSPQTQYFYPAIIHPKTQLTN